ncbi:hypothetical protein NS184_11480 [Curtobacterium luteum]|uniref:Uncharacterized protein n=1 Tax=Curtobacterium luteum TaxID=33881 RepID=A0A175RMR0_9MICO|nr:hypothetical protein NS184_11480 [Curtobacterium luteum]
MGQHRATGDRQVGPVEDELVAVVLVRRTTACDGAARHPSEHDPHGRGRDRRRAPGTERRGGPAPHLRGDRGPGRVLVRPGELEALQARTAVVRDHRADTHRAVAHHDRQVRHVAARPRRPERRLHHVLGDDHGERERAVVVGVRSAGRPAVRDGRRAGADHRGALPGQLLGDQVGERPGPVHLDAGRRRWQDLHDRRGRGGEHRRRDVRSAAERVGERGQGIATRLTPQRAEETLLGRRGHGDHRARRIDPELHGRRVAPHELERRVDADAHAPTVPHPGGARGGRRRSVENPGR